MWSLHEAGADKIEALRERQQGEAFSYAEVGATRTIARGRGPVGFNYDETRARIGEGEEEFAAACAALRAWVMFPAPWTKIAPAHALIREGTVVAMQAHSLGLWWLNACRVVYVIDDENLTESGEGAVVKGEAAMVRRFGFAYGTLPAHVECGEERFSVELHADGGVWYDLRAFSRPRYWLVRLAKPIARRLQWRFARDSVAAMKHAVAGVAAKGVTA